MVNRLRAAVGAALLSLALAAPATAQTAPPPEGEVARLIWSTLIALDHANRTGNYTVLRDLSADGVSRGERCGPAGRCVCADP